MNDYNQDNSINTDGSNIFSEDLARDANEFAERISSFLPPSRDICEECLKKSFPEVCREELYGICNSYFKEDVGRRIGTNHDVDEIINKILDYCDINKKYDTLWEILKVKRKNQYDIFYHRWKNSDDNKENELNRIEELSEEVIKDNQDDPSLQGENFTFDNDWFYNELDGIEQSMALTAALFQGVRRNIFNELNQYVHALLLPESEQEVCKKEDAEGDEVKNNAVVSTPPRLQAQA